MGRSSAVAACTVQGQGVAKEPNVTETSAGRGLRVVVGPVEPVRRNGLAVIAGLQLGRNAIARSRTYCSRVLHSERTNSDGS